MTKKQINEFKQSVIDEIVEKYGADEDFVKKAVRRSYLTKALNTDPEEAMHRPIEEWAKYVYERHIKKQYVLSLSYGKDSLACLEAIRLLGLPLDRIIHAEVWATDTIPADLPPMVEFKAKADRIIKERYGIEVEHVCATAGGGESSFTNNYYTLNLKPENTLGRRTDSRCSEGNGVRLGLKQTLLKNATYERMFYKQRSQKRMFSGQIIGFPRTIGAWCNSDLKMKALRQCFQAAPLYKERIQILCNILE